MGFAHLGVAFCVIQAADGLRRHAKKADQEYRPPGTNDAAWKDKDGRGCDKYTNGAMSDCQVAEYYANANGVSALDACQSCGGSSSGRKCVRFGSYLPTWKTFSNLSFEECGERCKQEQECRHFAVYQQVSFGWPPRPNPPRCELTTAEAFPSTTTRSAWEGAKTCPPRCASVSGKYVTSSGKEIFAMPKQDGSCDGVAARAEGGGQYSHLTDEFTVTETTVNRREFWKTIVVGGSRDTISGQVQGSRITWSDGDVWTKKSFSPRQYTKVDSPNVTCGSLKMRSVYATPDQCRDWCSSLETCKAYIAYDKAGAGCNQRCSLYTEDSCSIGSKNTESKWCGTRSAYNKVG